MHYNKVPGPGTAVCSNIQAGITFQEPGDVIRFVTGGDNLGMFDFEIPAGAESYSSSREYVFEQDLEILRFMPHMHLRGKAALYEVTFPDGEHDILLHVPKYDFNWQHSYEFRGMGYLSYRELEERHIVVGEPIPDDLREADSGDNQNDGANDG